jgi:hypothetical protein
LNQVSSSAQTTTTTTTPHSSTEEQLSPQEQEFLKAYEEEYKRKEIKINNNIFSISKNLRAVVKSYYSLKER